MREARTGLFTGTRSLNGSGRRVRCFGFTVNVRHPFPSFHSRVSNVVWAVQPDLERALFRTRHSISPFRIADILTRSTIIEEITRMSEAGLASMANFYFDFRDSSKQDVRGAVSSLLTQLSAQSDACCDILGCLYKAHNTGSKEPSEDALRECLKNMLSLEDQGPIFLVFDAIDECPNSTGTPSPRENVLELIEWLSELHYSHLSICVTSRLELDIEAVLLPLASYTVSLHGEDGQKEDIDNYIKWFIKSDLKARKWRKEDKELVLKELSERAGGM
jgi:hypothetical protein